MEVLAAPETTAGRSRLGSNALKRKMVGQASNGRVIRKGLLGRNEHRAVEIRNVESGDKLVEKEFKESRNWMGFGRIKSS